MFKPVLHVILSFRNLTTSPSHNPMPRVPEVEGEGQGLYGCLYLLLLLGKVAVPSGHIQVAHREV